MVGDSSPAVDAVVRIYLDVSATVLLGSWAMKLCEAGRARSHAAALLAIDPAQLALLFQAAGELPLISCCLSPLSVHHYLIATALGTIATAVPVNRKHFPLERNLLLVFELVLWCWSCALGHCGSKELLFHHYGLHQMTGWLQMLCLNGHAQIAGLWPHGCSPLGTLPDNPKSQDKQHLLPLESQKQIKKNLQFPANGFIHGREHS